MSDPLLKLHVTLAQAQLDALRLVSARGRVPMTRFARDAILKAMREHPAWEALTEAERAGVEAVPTPSYRRVTLEREAGTEGSRDTIPAPALSPPVPVPVPVPGRAARGVFNPG